MVPQRDGRTDTFVLYEGTARLVDPGASARFVELSSGDVFGMLTPTEASNSPEIVAVTDCEVVIIDAEAAGAVASRNPELNNTLNRLIASRLRRLNPTESISVGLPPPPIALQADSGEPASDVNEGASPDDD